MDVVKTIRPGDPGSQRFLAEWGERLVAVRYRKPADGRRILTTIEVIVDERAHRPGVNQRGSEAHRRAQAVAVRIHWQETELREKAKAAGARWTIPEALANAAQPGHSARRGRQDRRRRG